MSTSQSNPESPAPSTGTPGATPESGGFRRRSVLKAGATAGAVVAGSSLLSTAAGTGVAGAAPVADIQFRHGVASGDPMPDRVVLWTRVTPTPDAVPGSNVGPGSAVRWEVATDRGFGTIVRSGTQHTDAGRDHTVKLDCTGLTPNRWYYFRFHSRGQVSPIGRTRTAPAPGTNPGRVRIALMSCSNWEAGFFAAYRHLADRNDLDAVMHVGDYIYEYEIGEYAGKHGVIRPHDPPHDLVSLRDYRVRIGQYRTDPELQRLHAHVPWICTWDDHESANDSWAHGAENHDPATQGSWHDRRGNSYKAYFEWLPIREQQMRDGGQMYRKLSYGSLAEISVLDLRTYRSLQPSMLDGRAIDDPNRTMTGAAQFDWLKRNFETSTARWNVIGNSVMITPVLIPPLEQQAGQALHDTLGVPVEGVPYNADQWDGYAAERRRLFETMRNTGKNNFVFLTGDIHTSWACDLPNVPANYPGAGTCGVEFVCPSITAKNIDDMIVLPEGNPLSHTAQEAIRTVNHHVRWVDLDRHGFTVVEFTNGYAHADWWFLHAKEDPHSGVYLAGSWRVPHGTNRVEPAGPLP